MTTMITPQIALGNEPPTTVEVLARRGHREVWITAAVVFDARGVGQTLGLVNQCAAHGVETVHLMLNSPGAREISPAPCLTLYHGLRAMSSVRLVTYNTGLICSGAILPFLAGDERVCAPASQFLLHGTAVALKPHPTNPGQVRSLYAKDLREYLATIEASNDCTAQIYRDRTCLTPEEIEGLVGELVARTPAWAVEKGVAHAIRQPQIPRGAPHIMLMPSRPARSAASIAKETTS